MTTGATANTAVKSALLSNRVDKFEGNAVSWAPAPAPAPSYEERYAQALNMLDTYFDVLDTAAGIGKKDGKIGEKDLKAALKNLAFPEELREACRFLLNNKSAFKHLKSGWWSSTINKKSVANALSKLPESLRRPNVMDSAYQAKWANALNQLNFYFDLLDTAAGKGKRDGKIGHSDLKAALKNLSLPQELREACRFFLNNPAAYNQLDAAANGKRNGLISKQDIAAMLEGLPAGAFRRPSVIDTVYQANWANALNQLNLCFDLLDTAAGKGKKDGLIGHSDLRAASKNPALPQELREACRFLLNNPAAYNQLDAAANGKRDGLISRQDVATALQIGKTGLGDEVDALAALSPSLWMDLERLKSEGWRIKYGDLESGVLGVCNSSKKTITISNNSKEYPISVIATLAHEIGHTKDPTRIDYSSKEAYVNSRLAGEGAAEMNGIEVHREILANGGPNIGYSRPAYDEIYERYLKGEIDAARVRKELGDLRADIGNPSYREGFESWYDEYYDKSAR